ncbi:hypothetical protein FDP41_003092 [Naegleria fowleri]|uniref:WKF domain-containing protein n=1 Tax=Naegleria fowleri TaxID=5763 RepID=A0A6A5BVI7_NAEFO|nr:uncharacterized protein FDP41_003092 [Naegleria fowleri]KAF0977770.1 hypothetical protein FDP41_003092 [Naegleria fowleri]CAG4710190.1 unnamed protein product [Naegleria fowleri]
MNRNNNNFPRRPNHQVRAQAGQPQHSTRNVRENPSEEYSKMPSRGSGGGMKRKLESEQPSSSSLNKNHDGAAENDDDEIILHPVVEFLDQWKNDKENWTFDGTKQRALIHQCLNAQIIDSRRFKYFLEYIAPMVGFDRVKLYETCAEYVKTQRRNAQKSALHELSSKERKSILTDPQIRTKCVKAMKDILSDNKRYKRAKTIMLVLKATDKDSGSRYNLEDQPELIDTDYDENSESVSEEKNVDSTSIEQTNANNKTVNSASQQKPPSVQSSKKKFDESDSSSDSSSSDSSSDDDE